VYALLILVSSIKELVTGEITRWGVLGEEYILSIVKVFLWTRERPCVACTSFYRQMGGGPLFTPLIAPSLSSSGSLHMTRELSVRRTWSSPFWSRGVHLEIFLTTYPYIMSHALDLSYHWLGDKCLDIT
jgi:hypothetical protein